MDKTQIIHEKVSVITVYNADTQTIFPAKIAWKHREYRIEKLGYHHKTRQGRTLIHIFSVSTSQMAFRLELNTDTLHWTLEEIYDELAA